MRYTWANTFILVLAAASLATGFLALVAGSPDAAWRLHAHRIVGLAVAGVLVWKLPNVVRPLVARWGAWTFQDVVAVLVLTLVLVNIGLGVAWAHVGPFRYALSSGISWHINLALAVVPLLLWHTVRYRRLLRPRYWAERRSVLRMVGLLAVGVALWRAGAALDGLLGGRAAERRFTGSYPAGDFTGNAFPTTSWLNDRPAPIDPDAWRLRVGGAVRRPLTLGLDELASLGPGEEPAATLDCTGGWHSTQAWRGVPLGRLLDRAEPNERAASVSVVSTTGYYRRFSLAEARELLLATHVGGEALSHGHGAPVRLVAPGRRGYEWVKWVSAVELNETGKWLQPPLPLQ
ncbi:MAG: molybdopterin-dependent oxidoreductase [Planctomycetes bacterium]|nr:molybdopterin-dependent oxidoreductase [Planctomycetota bacterium]